MKKVKLLTFHNAENYGAALQAYALKETLKKLDVKPNFVNYIDKNIIKDYVLIRTNSLKSFFSSILYLPRNIKRKMSFRKFANMYLDSNSTPYYNKEELEKDMNDDDIYIAGSDQIFNPNLTNGLSDVYTLNFRNDKITKIIYGASVGNEDSIEKHKNDFKDKLEGVDKLSVREAGVIELLKLATGKNIEKVLDPTLLLERTEWDSLITRNKVKKLDNEKYILVYTLFENNEITKIANYLTEKTGMKVIHFRKYSVYDKEKCSLYTNGPADFVNAFKNAEYVITNSFHGLVFSIIYERKFYVVMPSERAGRLKDLINELGLEQRAIQNTEDILNINIDKNIDFAKAKKIVQNEKEKSIEYLKKGINLK